WSTIVVLVDPLLGKGAVLDVGQQLLHGCACLIVDDLRAGDVIAPLSSIRDRVAHVVQTALVEQVNDQLQLVHALEVGNFGLIASLNQRLEAGLHQRRNATTQHSLLTEQVGLRLLGEGGLEHARLGAAKALAVRQSVGQRLARSVLVHSDQSGHTTTLSEHLAHAVAGGLRRNHAHVDTLRRNDLAVTNVKAVREHQSLTGG